MLSGPRLAGLKSHLDWAATLLAIAASVFVIWKSVSQGRPRVAAPTVAPLPKTYVGFQPAQLLGSDTAPVVLVEFSDFQCSFCRSFAESILPTLKREFVEPGRVQLAFRHLPLTIHPFAVRAAQASECAGRQGKFWEMHDGLFREQTKLNDALVTTLVNSLSIAPSAFGDCMNEEAQVKDAEADAKALGVTGTPTFFVGTRQANGKLRLTDRISGAGSVEGFRGAIQKATAETARR